MPTGRAKAEHAASVPWGVAVQIAGTEDRLVRGVNERTWRWWKQTDKVPAYRVIQLLRERPTAAAGLAPGLRSSGTTSVGEGGEELEMATLRSVSLPVVRALADIKARRPDLFRHLQQIIEDYHQLVASVSGDAATAREEGA